MKNRQIIKILLILLFSNYLFADTLNLQQGWNLVGTSSQMSLQELKTQIGNDNLLIVQGGGTTYKKTNQPFLNDFTGFKKGSGYWIKVDQNSSLVFTFSQAANTIQLHSGWNLIDPQELSLQELKTQIGNDNLLMVQGGGTTYKKTNQPFLNNFTGFKEPNGYWLKVQSDVNISFELTNKCKETQYKRVKTDECLDLKYPNWGFQDFNVTNEYNLNKCDQSTLQLLLDKTSQRGGGKIIIPKCTINITNGIIIGDNTILEGAGIGETIFNNLGGRSVINLEGKNVILRNFTVDKKNLGFREHGINGFKTKGNILVEFIEVKNIGTNENSGISFFTIKPLKNSRITVRYNTLSDGFIGIDLRVEADAKTLIYSNEAFRNTQYGIDMHGNANVEVAGNYLHDNSQAGAKSPAADNIIYHHNDINLNHKAGIVYGNGAEDISNALHDITIEYNDLSNNGGPAFAVWMDNGIQLDVLTLRENNVTKSTGSGYNIYAKGVATINIEGDHGKIWR